MSGYGNTSPAAATSMQPEHISKDTDDVTGAIERQILDVPTAARAQAADTSICEASTAIRNAPLELVAPFLSIGEICTLVSVSHDIFAALTVPAGGQTPVETPVDTTAQSSEAPISEPHVSADAVLHVSAEIEEVRAAAKALPDPKHKLVVPVLTMQLMDCDQAMKLVSLPHVEFLRVFSRVALELVKQSMLQSERQKLGRNFTRLRKLTFMGTALNPEDINGFLDNLLSRPELIMVNIEKNNLRDAQGAEILRKTLPNSPTETLCIRRNHIADETCEVLADVLRMNTPMRVLNLKANRVSDGCCKILAAALPENRNLTLLNVRCQVPALTSVAAQHFAYALQSNKTLLQLRLRRNKIDDKGACALADALAASNTTLIQLDLQANHVKTPGGVALARMLRMNHVIQEVHLALNKFDKPSLKTALCSEGTEEDETLGDDERLIFEELADV